MKKLIEALTAAALFALIGSAYVFMQNDDADAAERDRAVWTAKADR